MKTYINQVCNRTCPHFFSICSWSWEFWLIFVLILIVLGSHAFLSATVLTLGCFGWGLLSVQWLFCCLSLGKWAGAFVILLSRFWFAWRIGCWLLLAFARSSFWSRFSSSFQGFTAFFAISFCLQLLVSSCSAQRYWCWCCCRYPKTKELLVLCIFDVLLAFSWSVSFIFSFGLDERLVAWLVFLHVLFFIAIRTLSPSSFLCDWYPQVLFQLFTVLFQVFSCELPWGLLFFQYGLHFSHVLYVIFIVSSLCLFASRYRRSFFSLSDNLLLLSQLEIQSDIFLNEFLSVASWRDFQFRLQIIFQLFMYLG